jgi:hypothetical protein
MRRHLTNYTLPLTLIDALDEATGAGENRSRMIDLSIGRAYKDPQRLAGALQARLTRESSQGETKRVTVTTDNATYEKLLTLVKTSHLAVEHVLRLAIEALIAERNESLHAGLTIDVA